MDLLHTVLVTAFISVTALLLALTLIHRLRVRSVLLTWRAVGAATSAVWPIVFVGLVVILYVFASNAVPDVPAGVFGGYVLGGVLWLMSTLLSGTVVITDFGLVPEVGRPGRGIAWMQVEDYFTATRGSRAHFVFIYESSDGKHRRLELAVPAQHVDRFTRIVRAHVDDRMEAPAVLPVGRKAMEG